MPSDEVLIPEDEKAITFYGDEVIGALVRMDDEARVYVPLRPLCDYLGISWSAQYERIQRDEVLSEEVRFVRVTRTNSAGGDPEVLSLPLEFLPGWLFGISARRVKKELYERILLYRRECFRYLWDAFKFQIVPSGHNTLAPPPSSGAELAYELATAVQHLARQQMELEGRLGSRIDAMAQWAKSVERRVGTLELQLNPEEFLTETQAAELALAVKSVGDALARRDGASKGYPAVYSALYRRYKVTSYQRLAQGRLREVLDWLHAWYLELAEPAPQARPE